METFVTRSDWWATKSETSSSKLNPLKCVLQRRALYLAALLDKNKVVKLLSMFDCTVKISISSSEKRDYNLFAKSENQGRL